jgi:hypothetical protein
MRNGSRRAGRSSRRLGTHGWAIASIFLVLALPAGPLAAGGDIPDGEDAGTVIFGEGHVWRFFRGTEDLPAGWNGPEFDDSTWEQGPAGIGYGDEDDQTVLADMRCSLANGGGEDGENACVEGGYLAFFARTTFEAPEVPPDQKLFVKVSYDDGFALYVNGFRIGRVNLPDGEITRETRALQSIGDAPTSPDAVVIIPAEALKAGTNVLAASVHNINLFSSDASFVPRLIIGNPDAPEEPTCKEKCAEAAAAAYQACREEGLGEDACYLRKKAALEECLAVECGIEPEEPTCKEKCAAKASEAFQTCISEGGTEEACKAKKAEVLAQCLETECGIEPEEPTCKEKCAEAAAAAYQACREGGLGEDACYAQKAAAYQECLAVECGIEPPDEPTCEELCKEKAAKALRLCLEEGGNEEECKAQSQAGFEACIEGCGEQPPESPCGDECAATGNAVFLACLEAGGGKDECRKRADGIVALCLERCGTGTPCEDRCAVAAEVVLTGCAMAELPEEDCKAMANSVLERCVAGCEPVALSCEGGCEALAAVAAGECLGRGGSQDECDAAGAAVLEDCISHCGGEPVPDCSVQCEAKAVELYQACLAEGKGEEACAAARNAFLAGCGEKLGEVCEREKAALDSSFQLFRRGDSNRDGEVDLSDAVSVLGFLFLGATPPGCEDAADANDDGRIDITDPISTLGSLYLGNGPLPDPFGERGQDPTSDVLLCAF